MAGVLEELLLDLRDEGWDGGKDVGDGEGDLESEG